MIEVYTYLHGRYNVDEVPLLLDEIRVTRGHSRILKKRKSGDETKENMIIDIHVQEIDIIQYGCHGYNEFNVALARNQYHYLKPVTTAPLIDMTPQTQTQSCLQ